MAAFDVDVETYDAWYDTPKGRAVFASEIACLRPLLAGFPHPQLEVGVGTGRFAQALDVGYGIDLSRAALVHARERGVNVVQSMGEELPLASGAFGAVFAAFSLCFLHDPVRALIEARRILRPGGGVVLGLLLRGTPWADAYARRGARGHPVYRHAHFHSRQETSAMLDRAGLRETAVSTTLRQPPDRTHYLEEIPHDGYDSDAGFVAILALPRT